MFIEILRADNLLAIRRPVSDRRRETRSLDTVGVWCGVQTRQRECVRGGGGGGRAGGGHLQWERRECDQC